MLSSLQDLSGLFPGLFQRGQSAAAAEQAAQGRTDQAHPQTGRGGGRDSLSLSPAAQAFDQAAADQALADREAADDAAAAEGGALLGQAGGFIRQALETIRHDLAKALKGLGFDSDAIQNFTKAFVEPVLSALKEGVNFTAELSFAAFSQVTTLSSNGDFSQQTSLVAQSLEIEVNHDTGEVSVSLAKLSFEQQIQSTGGGQAAGATPLLVLDPEDLASPQELAAKILASGEAAAAAAPKEPAPGEATSAVPAPAAEDGVAEEATDETGQALQEKLAELRETLAEDAASLQTRLTIYSISVSKNDKGETVTKLLLDAQLSVARLAEDATAQEEAKSLDLTA